MSATLATTGTVERSKSDSANPSCCSKRSPSKLIDVFSSISGTATASASAGRGAATH